MQNRFLHIALLLVVILTTSCARKEIIPSQPRLAITVRLGTQAVTKAGVGAVTSSEAERTLSSLQVWVFRNRDGEFLGYLEPDVKDFSDGEEERLYISLDESVAASREDVDVYAVANLASTGLSLGESSERQELQAALMESGFFESDPPSDPADSSGLAIPETGLPYSARKVCPIKGNYPVLNAGSVTLTRTVSKLRFVFSQMADSDGVTPLSNFSVTSLSLNGGLIPKAEYLFNIGNTSYSIDESQGYENDPVTFPVPTGSIPACSSPSDYAYYSGQNATSYEELIGQGIKDGKLLATPYYYFRESPLALSGSIGYQLGTVAGTPVNFAMHEPGDFARGRSWIVYVYYSSGKINFTVSYTNWENGGDIPVNGDDVS